MALFLYTAAAAQRITINYWENAESNWPKWRVYDRELSHNEWFFRTDRVFLADWIGEQAHPLLIPLSEVEQPIMRALLMERFPFVQAATTAFEMPAQTQLLIPWSLEGGAFLAETAHLALLNGDTIWVLPPLSNDASRLLFSHSDEMLALAFPDSNISVVARTQQLPPGWNPAYQVPTAQGQPLARFNSELELRAWYGPDTIRGPGAYDFVLDWSVARPVSHEYGAFLQLLTPEWDAIAGVDQHIFRWLYPTVAWQPGQVFSQPFTLSIAEQLPAGAYRLVAGAWYVNGGKLSAESLVDDATGNIATIGWLKVAQDTEPAIPDSLPPFDIYFDEKFELRYAFVEAEETGSPLVNLYWTALENRPSVDATIFVHAVNEQGSVLSQSDIRPWHGRYPTHIWDAGEVVLTQHRLELPSLDGIRLLVGMYTQPDFARLPATLKGERLPNDVANLGELNTLISAQSP